METKRTESPIYARRWTSDSTIPSVRPHHARSASTTVLSNVKRTQNFAAKAAAQRLAQAMASRTTADDDDDEDDASDDVRHFNNDFSSSDLPLLSPALPSTKPSLALSSSKISSSSSAPHLARATSEEASSLRFKSNGKPALSNPPAAPILHKVTHLRSQSSLPPLDSPSMRHKERERRFFADVVQKNGKTVGNQQEASNLRDELDMVQEENEKILDKLRIEEEQCKVADSRVKDLEKQVAALGEGVSLEAKLLSRKEAALRQREAALRDAKQSKNEMDAEVINLHSEVKNAKDEVTAAAARLQGAESEVKALHMMAQRMVLTQKEMEEVVLKRCWLARYWGLAAHHGICADIAISKYEYWSSLAPLPFEVVISAGQKAKEEKWERGEDLDSRTKLVQDLNDLTGEAVIESMLAVEMGLKELAFLQVEELVSFVLAQTRRPSSARVSIADLRSPGEFKYMEAFELSPEESEDVLFKEAWLTYFWTRAQAFGIEKDIAKKRLQFWNSRSGHAPTSHDAVDVELGLMELRKLGIEHRLWETSRKDANQ
ncbi:hypothetical protein V2J09_004189 [Rumex salicifolius]